MYEGLGEQVISFLPDDVSTVLFNSHNVQRQSGGADCGLFALAFATAICSDLPVSDMIFNQAEMRTHLKKCVTTATVEQFPHTLRKSSKRSIEAGKFRMSYTRVMNNI